MSAGAIPDSGRPALRRYTQSYQYETVGNIIEMKHQLGSGGTVLWRRGYAYAAGSNRLLSSSLPGDDPDDPNDHSALYSYDARGALSNLPHLEGFTRDFRDQLRKVVLDLAGNEAWYAHDGAGQRVRKLVDKGATTEERIYVGGWEVWRKRVNGTLDEERTTLHVRDGERRVAMVETKTVADEEAVTTPVPRWRFQLDDQLGSAVSECDDEGGVFSYEELHPYGSVAWSAVDSALDVSPRRYRYTGMERDEETGLQAHGVRMYAPWLGRWDRPDPIGLGDGVNRWGYVHGGVTRGRDRTGNNTETTELPFSSREARRVLSNAGDGESVRRFKSDLREVAGNNDTVQVHVGNQTYILTGVSRARLVAGRENNFEVGRNAGIESVRGVGDLMTFTSSQPVKGAWGRASGWLGTQKTPYNVDETQGERAEFMAQVVFEEMAGAGTGAAHGVAAKGLRRSSIASGVGYSPPLTRGGAAHDHASHALPATTETASNSGWAQVRHYWVKDVNFQGSKVYQRDDLFDPGTQSSWKERGKTVSGTNVQRMASGRAPIGVDGQPVNLHHLLQTEDGAIAEVGQDLHRKYFGILHINTGSLPSGIDRVKFDAWKRSYWAARATDFN